MLMDNVLLGDPIVTYWVFWLAFSSWAAVFFVFTSAEARWVMGTWLANLMLIELLYGVAGFTRLLGLSHIVLWTPLVLYLGLRLPWLNYAKFSSFYIVLIFSTYALSLFFDYRDLWLWISHDRAPL